MPSSLPMNTAALRPDDLLMKGTVEQFIPVISVPIPSVQSLQALQVLQFFMGFLLTYLFLDDVSNL